MVKMLSLMTALLIANTPSIPADIEVAQANWQAFPRLVTEDIAVPNGDMIRRVQLMLQRDECEIEGQTARRFDIDINYAIRLDGEGNASRILVQDVGCRPLEILVGRIAADIVRGGHVRVTPAEDSGWYGNQINFNLR
jgi:hypothetical protein